jgi:peptide/nickel transport system substrate-binding protein
MRRAVGVAGAVVLAAALMSACGGKTAAQTGDRSVLTIGVNSGRVSLNPARGVVLPLQFLSNAALTHENPDGTLAPALATSWHYVGTGNENFELTLRQDARFSDGTPVTASAVKTWIEYFVKANGPLAAGMSIKSIDAVGQWTVDIHLNTPNPLVPNLLADTTTGGFGLLSSPAAVANPSILDTETYGAGPYVIDPAQTVGGSQDGAHYVFVPNKYYYDKSAIHFSKVIVKVIIQPSTMLAAISTGQLDVAEGDVSTVSGAKSAGLNVVSAPTGWDGLLMMDRGPALPNGATPNPLASVDVRQALNYAIDRNAIATGITGASAKPTSEPPTVDGVDPAYRDYYSYDPAKAKQLLASGGYPHGFTLNVFDQSYKGSLGDPVLQAMAKYFSAVGVELKITPGPTHAQFDSGIFGGTYSATGFVQQPYLPMYQFYGFYLAPKGVLNQHGGDDLTLDELYQKAVTAADPSQYWRQMSARVVTEAHMVPVFAFDSFYYTAKNIGGVAFSAATGYPYPTEWYRK